MAGAPEISWSSPVCFYHPEANDRASADSRSIQWTANIDFFSLSSAVSEAPDQGHAVSWVLADDHCLDLEDFYGSSIPDVLAVRLTTTPSRTTTTDQSGETVVVQGSSCMGYVIPNGVKGSGSSHDVYLSFITSKASHEGAESEFIAPKAHREWGMPIFSCVSKGTNPTSGMVPALGSSTTDRGNPTSDWSAPTTDRGNSTSNGDDSPRDRGR